MSTDASENTGTEPEAGEAEQAGAQPLLRVVGGNPSDEEVAVLTALVAGAVASASGPAVPSSRNEWGHADDRLRPPWGSPSSFINLRR